MNIDVKLDFTENSLYPSKGAKDYYISKCFRAY